MKMSARLENPHGPIKVGPTVGGSVPLHTDNFVSLPLQDAHKFLKDIATMYEVGSLTLRDRLVGVTHFSDRTLYCAKRLEPIPKLDAVRTIPFIIEIIHCIDGVKHNLLAVSDVKRFGSQIFYGLPEGDIEVNYLFPNE